MDRKLSSYSNNTFKVLMIVLITFLFSITILYSLESNGIDNKKMFKDSINLQCFSILINPVWANSLNKTESSSFDNIYLNVTSPSTIHGVAGEIIKINGTIIDKNPPDSIKSGIAYISIVDMKDKVPIDLEDWSASKGLYIPLIKGGQSLPIEWNIRLVKAGSYTIEMLFNPNGNLNQPSITSSRISMEVYPKVNLNPGNVLPVAFGTPIIVISILALIGILRGKATRTNI